MSISCCRYRVKGLREKIPPFAKRFPFPRHMEKHLSVMVKTILVQKSRPIRAPCNHSGLDSTVLNSVDSIQLALPWIHTALSSSRRLPSASASIDILYVFHRTIVETKMESCHLIIDHCKNAVVLIMQINYSAYDGS